MITAATPVASYLTDSIAEGYVFECSCGELYSSVDAAASCRKCRSYCVFGYCTHVVDIRTREVVWGEKPSAEEVEAAWSDQSADMLAEDIREEYWADLDEKEAVQVEEEEWEVYEAKAEAEGY